MSDLLEGYAYAVDRDVFGYKLADHTFVKAPNNGPAFFDCFGSHHSDNVIHRLDGASGQGNYAIANCYRDPIDIDVGGLKMHLPDAAGLKIYAIHGVCHQAANRFLWTAHDGFWPTAPTVKNARGYFASWSLYGSYGRPLLMPPPPWTPTVQPPFDFNERYRECSRKVSAVLGQKERQMEKETASEPTDAATRITALHCGVHDGKTKFDPNEIISTELQLVIDDRLGSGFEGEKVHQLRNSALARAKTVAESDLKGAAFANEINAIAVGLQDELEVHLGSNNYAKLTGMSPKERYAIVDPDLAERAGSHGRGYS